MSEDKEQKEKLDQVDLAGTERHPKQGSGKSLSMRLFKFILVIFILVAMGMCTIKYIS